MNFLFKPQKKDRIVAIFDIGSGSVASALVRISGENHVPVILKSIREIIPQRHKIDFESISNNMKQALYVASQALHISKSGTPDEIFCVVSSPWYLSETRVITMKREKPFIFNTRIAQDLLQKEIINLNLLYKEKYGENQNTLEIIEKNIFQIKLNGYTIDEPIGKKTNELSMHMHVSAAPKVLLGDIQKVISHTFNDIPVSFSSFIFEMYRTVKARYPDIRAYLLFDVGGEITDVAVVSEGVLQNSFSFPFGRQTLYRMICNDMDISFRDAQELFLLYNSGTLESVRKEMFDTILMRIQSTASDLLRRSIILVQEKTSIIPDTLFLVSSDDVKNWFKDMILSEQYMRSINGNKTPNVVMLSNSSFLGICNTTGPGCDVFLMLEAIAINQKIKRY